MDVSIEYITKYENRYGDLRARMDNDLSKFYLEEYTLKDSKDKDIPDSASITLNDPRTFGERAISILGTATRHFNVTGIDPSDQRKIEKDYREILEVNDDILSMQTIEPLSYCIDWFSSLRGWVMAQVVMYRDGDKYQPEILPLDSRWSSWEVDRNGTIWTSSMARMPAWQAQEKFGYDSPNGRDVDIRSVWTRENYGVFIGNRNVEIMEHKLGHCPTIILPVPTQPYLISSKGEDTLKRQGESIYASNRELYDKMNELVSIWATINNMQFMSPLVYISPGGKAMEKRPYGIGVVISLDEGEQLVELPTKELSASAQALVGQIVGRLQRGSLPHVDYGELSFELSALAIAQLTESRDQVFIPRLKLKSTLYRRMAQMLKSQIQSGGWETEIEDNYITLDTELYEGKFRIAVDFHAISPEQNLANYQVDQMAKVAGISKLTRFRDILRLEDPEGEIRQADLDNAHEEIPELRLYDYAIAQGAGDISEEKIAETRAAIIKWALQQRIGEQVSEMPGLSQPASQPKLEGGTVSKSTAMRMQNEQNRRQGAENLREGQKAKRSEVIQ